MVHTDWDVFSAYLGLLSLASVSIYCGALGSLPPSPHDRSPQNQNLLHDDDDDEDHVVLDRMSSDDAWLFPIVGSVVLVGMYALVKYMGKEWINWLLGWYFSVAGAGSLWKSTVSLAKFFIGRERWRTFHRNRLLLLRGPLEVVSLSFRTPTLMLLPVGILPSILYSISTGSRKSALLTDMLALSFSHNALSILKLDSFRTGCILLSGMFFYDICWVFGSDVMLTVANTLDVPIKLLWPKSMTFSTERGFAMLGLGDVVAPGLFIALALRYDHARAEKSKGILGRPYFYVTLTAYVVGLITTMTVMHLFGKAQPALLYLSPACIMSFTVTAVVRGELGDAWRWSDDCELSGENTAQEASSVASRALPKVPNGKRTPQPNDGVDGGDHVDGGVTEGDEEETTEPEVNRDGKLKKRKSRGRKKA